MFILGLRDAYGVKVAIWLILIWNVYFLVALYAGVVWLSFVLLAVAVTATCYGSFLLCKHRNDLIFSSKFAKEHAFPSSLRISRATFNMHLTGFLVFFLGPMLATLVSSMRPVVVEKMPLLYAGYLFGLPGVLGVLHHSVRKVVGAGAEQS